MIADIINIGDELLIGQVVNTNASYMAEKLNSIGINVRQISAVSDTRKHIRESINEGFKNADVLILTGGLGPTRDDITKHTLAEYFNSKMIIHEPTLKHVEEFFKLRGREITEINRRQAEVPDKCEPLFNANGTAPGMWFEKEGKILVSLPGVPFEMNGLMNDYVLPRLAAMNNGEVIIHKTVLTMGLGESFLSEIISGWEDALPKNIRLAYLPQPGIVRLRLTACGDNRKKTDNELNKQLEILLSLISDYVFGFDDDILENIVGTMLRQQGASICTAESCTGGYLAHKITSISGSSDYFKGAIISYSNELKEKLLGVEPKSLETFGAVSREVVEAMAVNARKQLDCTYALATSGIAGPAGGSKEKPVGTVWIALAGPNGVEAKHFLFGSNRERNIHVTALNALNILRKELQKNK
ncbi:MAG: competence/damage-inducible protein A [Bacteroidales bacterium]|jgi:nicotinamide-nucleotide amidase|nr:competence/damage-inducible protein A [Bacteroidales bacterium]